MNSNDHVVMLAASAPAEIPEWFEPDLQGINEPIEPTMPKIKPALQVSISQWITQTFGGQSTHTASIVSVAEGSGQDMQRHEREELCEYERDYREYRRLIIKYRNLVDQERDLQWPIAWAAGVYGKLMEGNPDVYGSTE